MLRTLKNTAHLIEAWIANLVYGFPSRRLHVIAITGTDGKTTSSTLLYHVLQTTGHKVALVSTVAAYIGETRIDTGFHVTTPSSFLLQRLLAKIAEQGFEYVVLEVTSHGIDQQRIWGIHPAYAAITNVTPEHLDYHKTFERYLETKARLLLNAGHAYINADAKSSYPMLKSFLSTYRDEPFSYAVAKLSKKIRQAAMKRFPDQTYNLENTALVTAIAKDIGIADADIARSIATFPGVPGRMEEIATTKGFRVIVDFAHTPNALQHALESVRGQMQEEKSRGRLIVVFGCAGLRDVLKRPMMGDIAARLADVVVLTAEDPRTENVWSIINQIKSGVQKGHHKIITVPDRKEAIRFAIQQLAKKGDVVMMCGKGHETSMCFGTIEYPWSDQDTVREMLA